MQLYVCVYMAGGGGGGEKKRDRHLGIYVRI